MQAEFRKVILKNLTIPFMIGVYPEEKTAPRDLIFHVSLTLPPSRAGETDQLADTYDYAKIENMLLELAGAKEFSLLESLAESILSRLFTDSAAVHIDLLIEKPNPFEMRPCTAAYQVSRARDHGKHSSS